MDLKMSLLAMQLFQELYCLNLYPNKHGSHNKSVIQLFSSVALNDEKH